MCSTIAEPCVNIKHYETVSSPVTAQFAANLTTVLTKRHEFQFERSSWMLILCANVQIPQWLDP